MKLVQVNPITGKKEFKDKIVIICVPLFSGGTARTCDVPEHSNVARTQNKIISGSKCMLMTQQFSSRSPCKVLANLSQQLPVPCSPLG